MRAAREPRVAGSDRASTASAARRRGALAAALLVAGVVVVGGLGAQSTIPGVGPAAVGDAMAQQRREPPVAALARACADDNPFFAVTRLTRSASTDSSLAPAVLAFYDTPNDDPAQQLLLASRGEVGAVFGLAYDWRRAHLYAGAYHRRGAPLGPGGPGQIYRLDMHTGAVDPFARLDAGPDRHAAGSDDAAASGWVGLSALGDLDVDPTGEWLLAVDLHDRRIHRLHLPDGRHDGAFAHGGAAEPWAERARPFGLGAHGGWLYHTVLELTEPGADSPSRVHVYRSLSDGTRMTRVAAFDLDYARRPAWSGWTARGDGLDGEPMAVDVDFASDGSPLVGIRDRRSDASLAPGAGDVLPLRAGPGGYQAVVDPEHFDDQFVFDESLLGGIATFPGADLLVAGATAPISASTGGGVYLDIASGAVLVRETLAVGAPASEDAAGSLGDVEALCGPPGAPTLAPTPTPSPTPTSSPTPAPAFLPLSLRERCLPKPVDVALVIDASSSMREPTADGRTKMAAAVAAAGAFLDLLDLAPPAGAAMDRAAVVGFNSTAWTAAPLTSSRAALAAGLAGLASRVSTGSRLDLALDEGAAAVHTEDRGRGAVLILLSDGLPNGVPPAEDGSPATTVLRAAASVRALGVHSFTIAYGSGDTVGDALLIGIAGDAARFRLAPTPAQLEAIYAELALLVRCPPGRHAWGVPWP